MVFFLCSAVRSGLSPFTIVARRSRAAGGSSLQRAPPVLPPAAWARGEGERRNDSTKSGPENDGCPTPRRDSEWRRLIEQEEILRRAAMAAKALSTGRMLCHW